MHLKPVLIFLVGLSLIMNSTEAANCAGSLLNAIQNSPEMSTGIILNTGKNINDLGDIDGCHMIKGLKYGTMRFLSDLGTFYLGFCLPEECENKDLQVVCDALVQASGGLVRESKFSFTSEESVDMDAGLIIGFIFFFSLFAVCLFGMVVEYTNVLDKPKRRIEEEPKDPAHKKTVLGKVFISFSFSRNFKKIFYSPFNSEDNLKVLNGVRVLSMLYVVCGHAYFNVLYTPAVNPTYLHEIVQPLWWQLLPGAFYAVDVFFYLSSFLGAYLMVDKFMKSKRIPFFMIYFHRYYRLAPTVLLLILFVMTFYRFLGDGPVWQSSTDGWIRECGDYWWSYPLFINSFIIKDRQPACLGWLWYLSHDMMFFITLPIQVFLYIKRRAIGYAFASFMLVANLAIVLGIVEANGIGPSVLTSPDYAPKLYFVPWTRFGAYQVGVLVGFLYYEYIAGNKIEGDKRTFGFKIFKSIEISKAVRYFFYVLGFAIIVAMLFIPTPETRCFLKCRYYSQIMADFFNPLCRPLYVLGLGMILAGPLTGKGSLLQWLLGSRFWAPWAKISFFAYLIHLLVFNLLFGQERQAFYLQHKPIFWAFFTVITLTLLLAIPMGLFLEAPFMQLERLVLFPPRKKKEQAKEPVAINESRNGSTMMSSLKEDGFDEK